MKYVYSFSQDSSSQTIPSVQYKASQLNLIFDTKLLVVFQVPSAMHVCNGARGCNQHLAKLTESGYKRKFSLDKSRLRADATRGGPNRN